MLPSTVERVPRSTDEAVNDKILENTARRVVYFAGHSGQIDHRLRQLDREWDIERVLEANAAAFGFLGVALAMAGHRRWLRLSMAVSAFLFQHALQGWCPPVPMFRRLGMRTAREIEVERIALKALRGDFDGVADASTALEAAAR
jgi:hypothetical protein